MPRRSWATRRDGAGHGHEHYGVRVAGREGQLDLALQLLDADGDLHEGPPDRLEGRAAPTGAFRCRPSQRMQQPVGAHMHEEAELVGLPARARRLVGSISRSWSAIPDRACPSPSRTPATAHGFVAWKGLGWL